ncbi:MAG: ATP-binding protein [Actinomycetota bacterium]|nr:ATP-binding protein [Actinomycetota bacterium]
MRDIGRGISPEELDSVFDEFYQVRNPDAGNTAGTGLGLPVSAHLAELLCGALEARSTLGEGSVFTLELPREGPTPDGSHTANRSETV